MNGTRLDTEPLVRQIRGTSIINRLLIAICENEHISKAGVKSVLQERIIRQIQMHAANQDIERFNRLKGMILNPASAENKQFPPPGYQQYPSPAASSTPAPQNFHAPPNLPIPGYQMPSLPYAPAGVRSYIMKGNPRIEFKPSPFLVIQEQLNMPAVCEAMNSHRHTVKIPLSKSQYPILERVEKDPTLRVMVFGSENGVGLQDVAFPHQSEIKVNTGEVKANLRGLKNKPGSTRPVDITSELALSRPTNYVNTVEMTYALTTKKFYLITFVVKAVSVTELAKRLETGKRITEESVRSTMISKSRDADIVATASVLSLKCPLSTLRIDLPCRGIACKHNQCFDATSYLQLQEQAPIWSCPICNNPASFENLAVDEYVKNILKNTSKSTDQVTIQPDGKWELHSNKREVQQKSRPGVTPDSDDDLVEVTKSGDSVRANTPRISTHGYPSQAPLAEVSREPSVANGKRTHQVIDLTSSGDEDEEPLARPTKRQNTSNGTGSAPSLFAYPPATNGYYPPRP